MQIASRLVGAALVIGWGASSVGAADREFFKVGGGGGIAFLSDSDVDLPILGTVGGFIGYRVSDNVSLEGGLYFARSSRVFTLDGSPVDENTPVTDDRLNLTRTHYNAEGTLVVNLGRRRQFHPFILGGAGAVRIENDTTLIQPTSMTLPTTTSVADYVASVHFGAGFDLYFLYNVAARAEVRYTLPDFDNSIRSIRLIFGATYFF